MINRNENRGLKQVKCLNIAQRIIEFLFNSSSLLIINQSEVTEFFFICSLLIILLFKFFLNQIF